MYIKNSEGVKDGTWTLCVIAFFVVIIKVLIAGGSIEFMGNTYNAGTIGAEEIAALLTPMFGTYAFRKHTEKKFAKPDWTRTRADEDRESIS